MNRLPYISAIMIMLLALLYATACPQSTLHPKGVNPHKSNLNLKGSLYFSHFDDEDPKKFEILRFTLADRKLSKVAEIAKPDSTTCWSPRISHDGNYFSIAYTPIPNGRDPNAIYIVDVKNNTMRSFVTEGRISDDPAYSDGKAFVTFKKFETHFEKGTTFTLTASDSSLAVFDLDSKIIQYLRLPVSMDPHPGDYQNPHFQSGDLNKLYFYSFHPSDYDGYYRYDLKNKEFHRERRHIPYSTPDGKAFYFETSDRFSPSEFEPTSKKLGWRLCCFMLKAGATYDDIRPIGCAEHIKIITYHPGSNSFYLHFLGLLMQGKYALLEKTDSKHNSYLLIDVENKKEVNILDTDQSYSFAGIVKDN